MKRLSGQLGKMFSLDYRKDPMKEKALAPLPYIISLDRTSVGYLMAAVCSDQWKWDVEIHHADYSEAEKWKLKQNLQIDKLFS